MNVMLLRLFQRQVLLQCEFIIWAAEDLNAALTRDDAARRVFYAIQSMLSSQANISKALWGDKGRRAKERAPLRATIGVLDNSPLQTTHMRNNYDHYDERLVSWWSDSTRHIHLELYLGPPSGIAGIDPKDRFREFDRGSCKASFWGQQYDIQALVNEVLRILPKLREEAEKPHWE